MSRFVFFSYKQRHFLSLLWYVICIADGSLYVLNCQHGTETCRKIQEMQLAEGKQLEDCQEYCYVDILKYKKPWRIWSKVAGFHQAGSQSVTWIPLSEGLDNVLLYLEDEKRKKEPEDFERFKTAVVQAAVNSAFLAPESSEEPGHTVCVRASHGCSAQGLAHCMTLFSLVRQDIRSLERHVLPGILLRRQRGYWCEEPGE